MGLALEFPRSMVLGDFNLPFPGLALEVAQEFMIIMAAMGLSQITSSPTQDSSHMTNTIFLWSNGNMTWWGRGVGSPLVMFRSHLDISEIPL